MALDNAAADNAKSLLNGIDYSALIGGPLTAAITAQAMAARSTYEFIREVGLQTKDGVTSAVNVVFEYQKDGEMVRLSVPILTIVPIPLIVIDEIDIQFKASINASASQSTEDTSSQSMGGDVAIAAKGGWGPFSVTAKINANYSSKKDSKATQDSKYSVEYTQDVHVHASQAGMPAGLATVLNILSSAAGVGARDGSMKISPASGTLSLTDKTQRQFLQIICTDSNGLLMEKAEVRVEGIPDGLAVAVDEYTKPMTVQSNSVTILTDEKGVGRLLFWVEDPQKVQNHSFRFRISAKVGEKPKTSNFPVQVLGSLPLKFVIAPDKTSIASGSPEQILFTINPNVGTAPSGCTVTVTSSLDSAKATITPKLSSFKMDTPFPVDSLSNKQDLALEVEVQSAGEKEIRFTMVFLAQDGSEIDRQTHAIGLT